MPRKPSNNDERFKPPKGLRELIDDIFTRALLHDPSLLVHRRGLTEKQMRQMLQKKVRIPNTDISPWSKGNKDDSGRISKRLLALFTGESEYIEIRGDEAEKAERRESRRLAERFRQLVGRKEGNDVQTVCDLLRMHIRMVEEAKREDRREGLQKQKLELQEMRAGSPTKASHERPVPEPTARPARQPGHIVQRKKLFEVIWSKLTDPEKVLAAKSSFALVGGGGYGKSTLAASISVAARDSGIFDIVIQTSDIGKRADAAIAAAYLIARDLEPSLPNSAPVTVEAAAELLSQASYSKQALIIVDNIWSEAQHRIFRNLGPDCVLLVTTRVRSAVMGEAEIIDVGPMTRREAYEVLRFALPTDKIQQAQIRKLARLLYYWPQLLGMANRVIVQRCARGSPVGQAILDYKEKLLRRGITGVDPINEGERSRAVNICFDESIEELSTSQLERFLDLGAFLRSREIPIGIVERLWQDHDADEFLLYLSDGLALVQEIDFGARIFSLHDNVAAYLEQRAGEDKLIETHRRILRVFSDISSGDYALVPPEEKYAWASTVFHLNGAGDTTQADDLRSRYAWVKGLLKSCDIISLIECYEHKTISDAVLEIGEALRHARFALARSPTDLPRQIFGRLYPSQNSDVEHFVHEASKDPGSQPSPILPHLLNISNNYQKPTGHSATVRSAMFSVDGQYIATASWDGTAIIWDVRAAAISQVLLGHTGQIQSTAWSPNGLHLATAGGAGDQTVRIWDPETGDLIKVLGMHDERVRWVTYGHTDGEVISVSHDMKIIIWPVEGDDPTVLSALHVSPVLTIDVTEQSGLAVTASQDETLRVIDLTQGKTIAEVRAHDAWLKTAFWHPSGSVITSASDDGSVAIWQLDGGSLRLLARISGFKNGARSAKFSPDGMHLAVACGRGAIIYDVSCLQEPKKTGEVMGHSAEVLGVDFSPCGRKLVTCSHDHTARLFDLRTRAEVSTLGNNNGRVRSLSLSFDCLYCAAVFDDDSFEIREARTGRRIYYEPKTDAQAVSFANTSNDIFSASRDGTVSRISWGSFEREDLLSVHESLIHCISISHDDKFLVSASEDNCSALVSLAEKVSIIRVNELHSSTVKTVCADNELRSIFCGSDDRTATVWSRHKWKQPKVVLRTGGAVLSCSSKLDGSVVAFGSSDMVTYMVFADGGIERITDHTGAVTVVSFAHDDDFLITGSQDKTVRVFDCNEFRCLTTIELDASVSALSCRGKTFCIGDNLGGIHLFEIPRGFGRTISDRGD